VKASDDLASFGGHFKVFNKEFHSPDGGLGKALSSRTKFSETAGRLLAIGCDGRYRRPVA
jgi:hypothetical protein